MNIKLRKMTLFILCLIGTFMFSTASNAYYVYVNTYHHYHGVNKVRVYCKYTSGYWQNGYWHYGHKVCYTRRR